jgi:hypothetical protein
VFIFTGVGGMKALHDRHTQLIGQAKLKSSSPLFSISLRCKGMYEKAWLWLCAVKGECKHVFPPRTHTKILFSIQMQDMHPIAWLWYYANFQWTVRILLNLLDLSLLFETTWSPFRLQKSPLVLNQWWISLTVAQEFENVFDFLVQIEGAMKISRRLITRIWSQTNSGASWSTHGIWQSITPIKYWMRRSSPPKILTTYNCFLSQQIILTLNS